MLYIGVEYVMNNKGFGLIELLGCLVILGLIFGVGLYSARGTLSTSLTTLDQVSENEIYDMAEIYIMENSVTWINNDIEYTCVDIDMLVDMGYFESDEVSGYIDKFVKVVRDSSTKVINSTKLVDVCE